MVFLWLTIIYSIKRTHPPCHARGVPLGSTQRQLVDQQVGQEEMAQVVHSKPGVWPRGKRRKHIDRYIIFIYLGYLDSILGKLYMYIRRKFRSETSDNMDS